ncbi:MAG: M23 family metallopeptidase [Deltaproteobacteria bacterium]|nr:M23 family metallopeptidase [Deltaproteobacteria bacterium]
MALTASLVFWAFLILASEAGSTSAASTSTGLSEPTPSSSRSALPSRPARTHEQPAVDPASDQDRLACAARAQEHAGRLALRPESRFGRRPLDAGDARLRPPEIDERAAAQRRIERFMACSIPPADGFDFPVGDPDGQGAYTDPATGKVHAGWYISVRFGQRYAYGIHPAEDWNGCGLANTDLGQPVHAVAHGEVVFADACVKPSGGIVAIQHVYYEDGEKKRIRSVYRHLNDIRVQVGQRVRRREIIASVGQDADRKYAAHLHLELRLDESLSPSYWPSAHKKPLAWIRAHYAEPSAFIRSHRRLLVPQAEPHLALLDSQRGALVIYVRGRSAGQHAVQLGRRAGNRRAAGLRTAPRGAYFVVAERRRAGQTWHEINFPSLADAARGRRQGLIAPEDEAAIGRAWSERRRTRPEPLPGEAARRAVRFEGLVPSWDHFALPDGQGAPSLPEGSLVVVF